MEINKKVSNSYFFSLFTTALLSFSSIGLVIFLALFSLYQWDSNIKAFQAFLDEKNSTINQIRIIYTKINTISTQLSSDIRLRRYILGVPGYNDPFILHQLLYSMQSIIAMNEEILAIEVFDSRRQVILSTHHGYWTADYGDKYFVLRNGLFGLFYTGFDSFRIMRAPEDFASQKETCLTLLIPVPEERRIGMIAVTFKLDRLVPPSAAAAGRIWAVSDPQGIVLANHPEAGDFIASAARKIGAKTSDETDPRQIQRNSVKYWYAAERILDGTFSFTYAVPMESLGMGKHSPVRYIPVVAASVLFLSILASILLNRRAQLPIAEVVKSVRSRLHMPEADSGNYSTWKDTFTDLNETLDTLIFQTESNERIISENREFLEENALRNLLFGRQLGSGGSFYESKFTRQENNFFLVVAFGIEKLSSLEDHNIKDSINKEYSSFLREILSRFQGGLLRTGLRNWTALLNLSVPADRSSVKNHIISLQKTAIDVHGVSLSAGLSGIVLKPEDIPLAYNQAVEALRYRTFYGRGIVIDAEELQRGNEEVHYFSIKDGQDLMSALRVQNESQITTYVHQLIQEKARTYSPELLNAYFLYLGSCVAKVAMEYNIHPGTVDYNIFAVIDNFETIHERTEYLVRQCKKIVESRLREQRRFKSLSLEIVLNYINENYMKPISLSIIARDLRVSVSYLSELLKKELGMSYVSYINNLRMEKSRDLLKNDKLTIKQISHMLGYYSEHSFIRNFKKHFGRTPADYRNRAALSDTGEKMYIPENSN